MKRITSTADVAKLVALRCNPDRVMQVRDMIATAGVLLRGHFQLQSGAHAEYFLRVRGLAGTTDLLDSFAQELLNVVGDLKPVAAVLCPESAGFLLGNAVASLAKVPVVVTKTDLNQRPSSELRMGILQAGTEVLLVNDVITSGNSLEILLRTARAHGANAKRAVALATIGSGALKSMNDIGIVGSWLIECRWPLYSPDSCELCKEDVPLVLSAELG